MTGYTLHNAEYRLCLERNIDVSEGDTEERERRAVDNARDILHEGGDIDVGMDQSQSKSDKHAEDSAEKGIENIGELTQEAQEYIAQLESSLSYLKKELGEVKRKNEALQLKQLFGDKNNELLNYLRSLDPKKVVELSEPTSHEVRDTIHSVVHGLLATLSPKMQSKAPPSDSEMKWYSTKRTQGTEDYSDADALLKFAKQTGVTVRGHNVFWDDPEYQPS